MLTVEIAGGERMPYRIPDEKGDETFRVDTNGHMEFRYLPIGEYSIIETTPAGFIPNGKVNVRREIERGTVQLLNSDLTERYEYSADSAQLKYERNAANKGRSLKIGRGHDLVAHIERKIGEEKMSPYAALQSTENEGKEFSV